MSTRELSGRNVEAQWIEYISGSGHTAGEWWIPHTDTSTHDPAGIW
jgi:hypothetical protein